MCHSGWQAVEAELRERPHPPARVRAPPPCSLDPSWMSEGLLCVGLGLDGDGSSRTLACPAHRHPGPPTSLALGHLEVSFTSQGRAAPAADPGHSSGCHPAAQSPVPRGSSWVAGRAPRPPTPARPCAVASRWGQAPSPVPPCPSFTTHLLGAGPVGVKSWQSPLCFPAQWRSHVTAQGQAS